MTTPPPAKPAGEPQSIAEALLVPDVIDPIAQIIRVNHGKIAASALAETILGHSSVIAAIAALRATSSEAGEPQIADALRECAAPYRFGTFSLKDSKPLGWGPEAESLAREFNRRQQIAAAALRATSSEKTAGEAQAGAAEAFLKTLLIDEDEQAALDRCIEFISKIGSAIETAAASSQRAAELQREVERLTEESAMRYKHMDWEAEQSAKKSVEIADLKNALAEREARIRDLTKCKHDVRRGVGDTSSGKLVMTCMKCGDRQESTFVLGVVP